MIKVSCCNNVQCQFKKKKIEITSNLISHSQCIRPKYLTHGRPRLRANLSGFTFIGIKVVRLVGSGWFLNLQEKGFLRLCENVTFVGGFTFVRKILLCLCVVLRLREKCCYIYGWSYVCGKSFVTFVGGVTFVGKMLLRLWVVLRLWEKCCYVCGWCYVCGKIVVTFVGGVTFVGKCCYVCGWCYICGKNVDTFVGGVTFVGKMLLRLWVVLRFYICGLYKVYVLLYLYNK